MIGNKWCGNQNYEGQILWIIFLFQNDFGKFLHDGKNTYLLLFLHVDQKLFEMLTIDYIIKTVIISWRVHSKVLLS